MSSSILPALTGEPITVAAAGHQLKVARYTPRMLGKLQEWIEANLHPLVRIRPHLKHLAGADRAIVLEATAREAVHFNSSALDQQTVSAMISHPDGLIVLLKTVLDRHNPGLDYEALADGLSFEEIRNITGAANGERPGEGKEESDPND